MTLRRVLIVDSETTGLDAKRDYAIEVGCVLWSVEHRSVIEAWSTLIAGPNGNPAEAINGIPASALTDAADAVVVKVRLLEFAGRADAIVAHSADFDRAFLAPIADVLPWICSCNDIEWPGARIAANVEPARERPGQSLVALCLAHGLGVSHAHRALTDCLLLARLLERVAEMGHDVEAMLTRGLRPKATFQALVSFDDKDKAKAAGFKWVPETKMWLRRMAVEDAKALPFQVREAA